jgi:hypothetical protein
MFCNFVSLTAALITLVGLFKAELRGDEIAIGGRFQQESASHLGLDDKGNIDQSRLITTGELWQFFHDRGITSIDQLTLNLDSGQDPLQRSGAIRFQIEDPINGDILTNLSINSSSNRLEVPLEYDYMKRFSPGSKELIRLDFSELNSLAVNTTISVDSESSIFGTFNVAIVIGFFAFWVLVFVALNRFTKPENQDHAEDIIIRSTAADELIPPAQVEASAVPLEAESQMVGPNQISARTVQQVVVTSSQPLSGNSKILSAR